MSSFRGAGGAREPGNYEHWPIRSWMSLCSIGMGGSLAAPPLLHHRAYGSVMAKGLRAGSVWINCYQAMDPAVPFGGYKMSGYGRESGIPQMEEYLNVKAVWINTA